MASKTDYKHILGVVLATRELRSKKGLQYWNIYLQERNRDCVKTLVAFLKTNYQIVSTHAHHIHVNYSLMAA